MNSGKLGLKGSIALLAFFLVLVGCGKDIERKSETHSVIIKQMKFQPSELNVRVGDTIRWTNEDLVPHDVTEKTNADWTSTTLNNGDSWYLIVQKSEAYKCSIHPIMTGKIKVINED